jgi:glucose-1-phosphate cytidylyltransferase
MSGYKGQVIKEYFLNYEVMNSDFTINLGKRDGIRLHGYHSERDWTVTLADTGEKTQTGGRIKRVEKYIDGDTFMLTYGDGLADINIKQLLKFHKSHGKIGTVTGIHLPSRFGELQVDMHCVKRFSEKQLSKEYVSGGFFIFNRDFFSYLNEDEHCVLENEPLSNLTKDGELMVFPHEGFWQCCDTYREMELLNNMWAKPTPPWKVWK